MVVRVVVVRVVGGGGGEGGRWRWCIKDYSVACVTCIMPFASAVLLNTLRQQGSHNHAL